MKLRDAVVGQIQQTDLLQLRERCGDLFEAVLAGIENLDLLARRTISQRIQTCIDLLGRPLRIVRDVERNQLGHLRNRHRELGHLRAVIDLQIGTRSELRHLGRQLLDLTIGDVEDLQLGQSANLGRQRTQTIVDLAVVCVVEVDLTLHARLDIDNLALFLGRIECRGGRRNTLLGQRTGARLRELRCGVNLRQVLLVVIHTVATTLAQRHLVSRRIVGQQIDVVVVAQIQLDHLGQLANRRRHIAREGKIAQIEACHTTIRMQLHTRLITPQVGVFIEIPICALREALANIVPALTIEALPNIAQGNIILQIFVGRVQCNGDRTLGGTIVRNREIGSRNIAEHLQHHSVAVVGNERRNAILARRQRESRIAHDRRGLIAVLHLVALIEVNRELTLQLVERRTHVRGLVLHRDRHLLDLVEGILALGRTGALQLREILHQRELHRTARRYIDRQVDNLQATLAHLNLARRGGRTIIYKFVGCVVKRKGNHLIATRQQLQLIAAQTKFGRLGIGCREVNRLSQRRFTIGQRNLHLVGLGQIVERLLDSTRALGLVRSRLE